MWLDVVFLIILIISVIKGAMQGIVLALFSFIGWLAGLAAALKLSSVVAAYLQEHSNISGRWLPILSFVLVFIVVVLLVRLAAKALESVLKMALLGWVNRLGGAILYAMIQTVIFCVILFYIDKMGLLSQDTKRDSFVYSITASMAPVVIDTIGGLIPAAKNIFLELENFFEGAGKQIA